jgi:UPF0716 protein FxsA
MRVVVGLLVWSLVEISLYVVVGGAIGLWATLFVVIGSAVIGVSILSRLGKSGFGELRQVRGGLAQGAHKGLMALGAILLILPGFLTDAMGAALMVPFVRTMVMRAILHFGRSIIVTATPARDDVIEAQAIEETPGKRPMPSGWTKP